MAQKVKKTTTLSLDSKSFEVLNPFDLTGWTFGEWTRFGNDSFDDLYELWDAVIVRPNSDDMLDEDLFVCYRVIKRIILPFIFLVRGNATVERPLTSGFQQSLTFPFIPQFRELDRFFDAYSLLEKAYGDGKRHDRLSRKLACMVESTGFKLRKEDWREYTFPDGKEVCLLLPFWVRNRLGHPENPNEDAQPDFQDIRRATTILYAAHWSTLT